MSDPKWYDRLPRWARQTIDQTAHIALGAAAASVLWIGQPIVAGLVAALVLAAVREREQWPPKRWWDLVLDTLATALGGVAMGLAVWGLA